MNPHDASIPDVVPRASHPGTGPPNIDSTRYSTIDVRRDQGVVTITLNRPARRNALNAEMWDELTHAVGVVRRSREDRCVVLTGAAPAFCAGADVTTMNAAAGTPAERVQRTNDFIRLWHELPQPTIAKVNGVAAGVGVSIALGSDLTVAARSARFVMSFATRGLSLDGGASWLLPRQLPMQRAKWLALSGETIDADTAASVGLILRSVDADVLDHVVDEMARQLTAAAPLALSRTKRLLDRSSTSTFSDALDAEGVCQMANLATEDTAEAIQAFLEKRTPVFHGR